MRVAGPIRINDQQGLRRITAERLHSPTPPTSTLTGIDLGRPQRAMATPRQELSDTLEKLKLEFSRHQRLQDAVADIDVYALSLHQATLRVSVVVEMAKACVERLATAVGDAEAVVTRAAAIITDTKKQEARAEKAAAKAKAAGAAADRAVQAARDATAALAAPRSNTGLGSGSSAAVVVKVS